MIASLFIDLVFDESLAYNMLQDVTEYYRLNIVLL